MFMDLLKIDYLTECHTIASLCFRIFKTHFEKSKTTAQLGRESQEKLLLWRCSMIGIPGKVYRSIDCLCPKWR